MKQQSIAMIVGLFLLLNISCDKTKTDPECKDASCCNPRFNQFQEYITDVPAHLSGPPQFSNWGIRVSTGYPTTKMNKSNIFIICENSLQKIDGLVAGIVPIDQTKLTYPYKISGKLLQDVKNPALTSEPVLYIFIDKIEKLNP
jgi:hypothetical protein